MHYAVQICLEISLGIQGLGARTVSMKSACTPILLRYFRIAGGGSTSLLPVPNKSSSKQQTYSVRDMYIPGAQRTWFGYSDVKHFKMFLAPALPNVTCILLWGVPQKDLAFQEYARSSYYSTILQMNTLPSHGLDLCRRSIRTGENVRKMCWGLRAETSSGM